MDLYIITRCDPIEMYVIMVSLLQMHMLQLSPLCYLFAGVWFLSFGMLGTGPMPSHWLRCHVHSCMSYIILSPVSLSKC